MQEYHLSPRSLARLRRSQALVLLLIVCPLPLYLAWRGLFVRFLPFMVVLTILLPAILWRTKELTRKAFETLRIHLDHQAIGRTGGNLPDLFLRFDEVTRITEAAGQGLVVYTGDPARVLGVPGGLEGFAEVRARLALMREIELLSGPHRIWRRLVGPLCLIAFLGAIGAAFLGTSAWLVAICSSAVLAVLGWSIVKLGRNPEQANRFGRMPFWLSLLPMAVLIFRLYLAVAALASGHSHVAGPFR